MTGTMMKCGHAANATNGEGKPSCAICAGINPGAEEVDTAPPGLTDRQARCPCGRLAPSDPKALAFFEYCGPGSREATDICKCGYSVVAHVPEVMARNKGLKCINFVARGPLEFDRWYCGHSGWD